MWRENRWRFRVETFRDGCPWCMDEESIYQASTTGLGRPQRPLKVCFIKVNFVFVDPRKNWTTAAAYESLSLWFMTQKCRQGAPEPPLERHSDHWPCRSGSLISGTRPSGPAPCARVPRMAGRGWGFGSWKRRVEIRSGFRATDDFVNRVVQKFGIEWNWLGIGKCGTGSAGSLWLKLGVGPPLGWESLSLRTERYT